MKKIIAVVTFIVLAVVSTANANASTDVELFIGNVPGVTDQDIHMCQDSYSNGGEYFHHLGNAKLSCARNHISVDFDHSEE